ncbi:MAG: TonB-dependent receptor [Bacteroidales bacterium]
MMKNDIRIFKPGNLMVFSRWSRKNNAAFLSLSKTIKISVLSASYFLSSAFTTLAQSDTLKIDEITVNAYKIPITFIQVPRIVTFINAGEISAAPLNSINDALKSSMNVDVRERGAYGIQADINFRGGSFEQNVVMLNGVKMNDPQTGHFQLNLPIDLTDLERIETVHGASSSVFGNNAFSGAVNLITGLKESNAARISLSAGQNRLLTGNLGLNLATKNFDNYLSISKKVSDGFTEDTDFDILNIFYNSKIRTSIGNLQFQAGYLDKSFGAWCFYTPVYPNQFEQNRTLMANIKFFSNSKLNINPSIYFRRNYDRFELFRSNPPAWYTNHNYHMTSVYGADINSRFNWILGKASGGIDWNTESIISNKLGDLLNEPIHVKETDSVFYDHGKTRQNLNFYLENHFNYNNLHISGSIMANWNSSFAWSIYPGIDASYSFTPGFKAIASFNISGRIPSFTDLYYVGPGNQGNINLVPEKSVNYEIGIKYNNRFLVLQSAIFYRQGKDIIDWIKLNADDLWQSANITNLNTTGYEIIAGFKFSEEFPVSHLGVSYTYLDMAKISNGYISKYTLDYLRHNINLTLNHKIFRNLTAGWLLNAQFRNGTYFPYSQESQTWQPSEKFSPVYMVDLKLNYHLGNFDFFIQGKNLLDQEQENIDNVPLPGRWISGGITANFSFKKQ